MASDQFQSGSILSTGVNVSALKSRAIDNQTGCNIALEETRQIAGLVSGFKTYAVDEMRVERLLRAWQKAATAVKIRSGHNLIANGAFQEKLIGAYAHILSTHQHSVAKIVAKEIIAVAATIGPADTLKRDVKEAFNRAHKVLELSPPEKQTLQTLPAIEVKPGEYKDIKETALARIFEAGRDSTIVYQHPFQFLKDILPARGITNRKVSNKIPTAIDRVIERFLNKRHRLSFFIEFSQFLESVDDKKRASALEVGKAIIERLATEPEIEDKTKIQRAIVKACSQALLRIDLPVQDSGFELLKIMNSYDHDYKKRYAYPVVNYLESLEFPRAADIEDVRRITEIRSAALFTLGFVLATNQETNGRIVELVNSYKDQQIESLRNTTPIETLKGRIVAALHRQQERFNEKIDSLSSWLEIEPPKSQF